MLAAPLSTLEYGGVGSRAKAAPVSRINIFDASLVKFSRAARVHKLVGVVDPVRAKSVCEDCDVAVEPPLSKLTPEVMMTSKPISFLSAFAGTAAKESSARDIKIVIQSVVQALHVSPTAPWFSCESKL